MHILEISISKLTYIYCEEKAIADYKYSRAAEMKSRSQSMYLIGHVERVRTRESLRKLSISSGTTRIAEQRRVWNCQVTIYIAAVWSRAVYIYIRCSGKSRFMVLVRCVYIPIYMRVYRLCALLSQICSRVCVCVYDRWELSNEFVTKFYSFCKSVLCLTVIFKQILNF